MTEIVFLESLQIVSTLSDHLVFSPKYRGRVLKGEGADATEEIIRENCKELDFEIIDMTVNFDHKTFKKSFIKKIETLLYT